MKRTYYRWYKGPDFAEPGGYWRRSEGWIVEAWSPETRQWVQIPSDGLSRKVEHGDPTMDEISEADFLRETSASDRASE